MTSDFEQPTAQDVPTRSGADVPWKKRIDYKSGKVPEAFVAEATPEKVKAGFSYYDKDAGAKFQIGNFTASIVAVTFGVSGTVPDGNYYINYFSNLVFDTRTQPIEVFHFVKSGDEWKKNVIATGFYSDFKAYLPDGVGYCKVLICWIHETSELVSINVSSQVETSLKEAIAEPTASSVSKINIFKIAESSDRFWAIRFDGKFSKRTRDGKMWNGQGDMFFNPSFVAKVATAEKFPILVEMKQTVKDYIEASEEQVWKAAKTERPTPTPLPHPDTVLPTQQQTDAAFSNSYPATEKWGATGNKGGFPDAVKVEFPTEAPPVNYEQGPEPGDDLPF